MFPELVGDGLYGFAGDGYWLDIGTPERYLQATFDILERNVNTAVGDALDDRYLSVAGDAASTGRVVPPALVEPGCRSRRAPTSAAWPCSATTSRRRGHDVERAVVLDGAVIGPDCTLRDCIVGAGARLGANTHIEGRRARRGRDDRGGQRARRRRAYLPRVSLPDGAIKF